MKAVRVHRFRPPEVISLDDLPKPEPGRGEVVVRVNAAGIGPWDALIRRGESVLKQPLPLILGSDLSGVVDSIGVGVEELKVGDEIFGVTNERFTGAYAIRGRQSKHDRAQAEASQPYACRLGSSCGGDRMADGF